MLHLHNVFHHLFGKNWACSRQIIQPMHSLMHEVVHVLAIFHWVFKIKWKGLKYKSTASVCLVGYDNGIHGIFVNQTKNGSATWIVYQFSLMLIPRSCSFICHEWCTYWTTIWYATCWFQTTKKWRLQKKDIYFTLFRDDKWLIPSLLIVQKHSILVEMYIIVSN